MKHKTTELCTPMYIHVNASEPSLTSFENEEKIQKFLKASYCPLTLIIWHSYCQIQIYIYNTSSEMQKKHIQKLSLRLPWGSSQISSDCSLIVPRLTSDLKLSSEFSWIVSPLCSDCQMQNSETVLCHVCTKCIGCVSQLYL